MKTLVTGDWQLAPGNLATFSRFSKWLLDYCISHGVTHLLHLGDVKHAFNPVDLRVVIAFSNFLVRCKKRNIEVTIMDGNHDKLAVRGKETWLPILKKLGCQVFTEPGTFQWDCMRFFIVPFTEDKKETKRVLQRFAKVAKPEDSVLFFHDEIAGCRMNVMTRYDGHGLAIADLHADKYIAVFGGHIHLPQRITDNSYYVGSPWAHDWNEVNHKKQVIVLSNTGRFFRVPTEMPGLYDPGLPKFAESIPSSWKGHTVRLSVTVPANKSYQEVVDDTKRKAEKDYPGASILVAESKRSKREEVQVKGDLIRRWVAANVPENLKERSSEIVGYLEHHLGYISLAQRKQIKIQEIIGHNVLSFDQVSMRFDRKGLTTIQGKNLDWKGRSNGSGKTNVVQLIAVLLFGRTLKGQKNSSWCKRRSKKRSFITGELTIGDNHVRIERGQKPVALRVLVNGKNRSVGTAPNTQKKVIEVLLGLNWEAFVSALYIDQQTISLFVDGGDTQRKAILAKFLGLDQFEDGLTHSKDQRRLFYFHRTDALLELESLRGFVERSERGVILTEKDAAYYDTKIAAVQKKLTVATEKRDRRSHKIAFMEKSIEKTEKRMVAFERHLTIAETTGDAREKEIERLEKLGTECPHCKQSVSRIHCLSLLVPLRKLFDAIKVTVSSLDESVKSTTEHVVHLTQRCNAIKKAEAAYIERCNELQGQIVFLKRMQKQAVERDQERAALRKEIDQSKLRIKYLELFAAYCQGEMVFMDFCLKALGKNGLRVHLLQHAAPALDSAVKLYARLFAEDHLSPHFTIEKEELQFLIENPSGGEYLDDQSRGERSLLSLIASLALRDVFSPFDLVIFDEPGEGLDQENARQFAVGLSQIVTRFSSVMLMSHNQALLQELQPTRTLEILKENGTSRVG